MKEKFGILIIVLLALCCLFGCSKDLPKEDMVWLDTMQELSVKC